jgi:hypothetical protein
VAKPSSSEGCLKLRTAHGPVGNRNYSALRLLRDIVVNFRANSLVSTIWVLWAADDRFFSPRKANTNAQSF